MEYCHKKDSISAQSRAEKRIYDCFHSNILTFIDNNISGVCFCPKKSINDKDFLGFYFLLDIPKNTIKLQYKCEVEMGSYFDSNIFSIQRE